MGVSIVYDIVKRYGGSIAVDGEPGGGMVIHLFFPGADKSNAA